MQVLFFGPSANCNCVLHGSTFQPAPPYLYKWYAVASNEAGTEVAGCWRNATAQGQGDASNLAYSTDGGQTWTAGTITSGSSADNTYYAIRWNGSWWVAVSGVTIARSQDGINWAVTTPGTFLPIGAGDYNTSMDVLPDNRFYGVYGNVDNTNLLISGNNGVSFTSYNVLPSSARQWTGVAHNGTNVVAISNGVGGGGTAAAAYKDIANITSAWSSSTMPAAAQWQQVIWNGTYFIATASTNTAVRGARSLTGSTWEEITLPTQAHQGVSLKNIANYGHIITDDRGSLWLSVWRLDDLGTPTTTGTFFCSSDHGSTWSEITYPTEDMWLPIGWSGYRLYGLENRTDAAGGIHTWYSDER